MGNTNTKRFASFTTDKSTVLRISICTEAMASCYFPEYYQLSSLIGISLIVQPVRPDIIKFICMRVSNLPP